MLQNPQLSGNLRVLQDDIDRRVQHITAAVETWPCRKGCDGCCRSLAAVPQATALEWDVIQTAVERLSEVQRRQISDRISDLALRAARPITCPFLERESGACLIYDARPVACRTYGFFVERDHGLFCQKIQEQVDLGIYQDVIWGNHASVDARLAKVGEPIDLLTWWAGV